MVDYIFAHSSNSVWTQTENCSLCSLDMNSEKTLLYIIIIIENDCFVELYKYCIIIQTRVQNHDTIFITTNITINIFVTFSLFNIN